MSSELLIQVSEWSVLIAAFVGLTLILGASLYDMAGIMRHRQLKNIRQSRLPHITVLVYVQENQASITTCLESIGQSQYPHFDIVVVDNASASSARQATKTYQKQHPHASVYFYGKRKATDRLTAVRYGYAKSQRGEVVFGVDGTSTVKPLTLRESGAMFTVRPSLQALRLHTHIQSDPSIASLLQQAADISQLLYRKCQSLFWETKIGVGEAGVLYRRDAFLHQARPRCAYVSMIYMTMRRDAPSNSRVSLLSPAPLPDTDDSTRLTYWWLRAIGAFYAIFLVTYFLYTAASLQSSSLLMLSWIATSLWFAVGVWSNESATWSEKLAMSFCTPVLYFLAYGYGLILMGVVIIRTIFRVPQMLKRQNITLRRTVKYVD